jgi:hypothetical protein
MGLPAEIRLRILSYLLDITYSTTDYWFVRRECATVTSFRTLSQNIVRYAFSNGDLLLGLVGWHPETSRPNPWTRVYELYPQILSVYKTLCFEGREVLYGRNHFIALRGVPVELEADFM